LHDRAKARIKNSLGACKAANAQNYAIECDMKLPKDSEAMVFHDFTLEKPTSAACCLAEFASSELQSFHLLDSQDNIPSSRRLS
jgi:glycerophosphoryl diester phosphodiesterase